MEEKLLSAAQLELFMPARRIPDDTPPAHQLEAVRQAPRQEAAFQGEDLVLFLVVSVPEAQRYQGRALNHWQHFFTNLCISLQFAHVRRPVAPEVDDLRPRGDVGSADAQEVIGASTAHHRQTRHTKTRSTGDRDWEREALGDLLAASAPPAEPQVVPAAALAASGTVPGTIRIGEASSQCAARQGASSAEDTDDGQQSMCRSTSGGGGVMIGTSHVMYRITTRVAVDERMLPAALVARVRVSPPSFPVDEAAFPPAWGAHSFMQRAMHGLFLRTSAARGARPRCSASGG